MNYFSRNIRFLRAKKGLSQAEMLDCLGFPRTTWSGYENGVSQPDIDGLIRIASFFELSVTDLLEEDLTESDYLVLKRSPGRSGEKKALAEGPADYRKASGRTERLLNEIVKARQQVVEKQEQTINALQMLVERLQAELNHLREEK